MQWIALSHRGVIAISGTDRKTFLQGLITQDIWKVSPQQILFSAFLTPQGRYLYDFFILEDKDTLYLECDRDILEAFLKRLKAYKLRLDVTLENASAQFQAIAVIGEDADTAFHFPPGAQPGEGRLEGASFIFVDPRLQDLGIRLLISGPCPLLPDDIPQGSFLDYDLHRLKRGVPDGQRDLSPEKAILLENGFEEMNGISWEKGCYLGQELTARTHYRGLVRKRLLPCILSGPLPLEGTPLLNREGNEIGDLRSRQGNHGLAMIRLEALFAAQEKEEEEGNHFYTPDGKTQIKPYVLPWMRILPPPPL